MKIAIGNDTKGYEHKLALMAGLAERGHEVRDFGCDANMSSVNYPEYAKLVGEGVASGEYDRGILICGTGIGMSIAANKVVGIRAALCYEVFPALMSREHNNANVLCTGGWVVTPEKALEIAVQWLGMSYAGGRHQIRLDQMTEMEKQRD